MRAELKRWKTPSYVISSEFCQEFAEEVAGALPGAEVIWLEDIPGFEQWPHAVVFHKGRYYDAQNPSGVDSILDLKYVKKWNDIAFHKRMHKRYGVAQRGWPDNPGLPFAEVVEQGVLFRTGEPVTFRYLHNTQRAPYFGSRFLQDIEPAGRYVVHNEQPGERQRDWEAGEATFYSPLVILFNLEPLSPSYNENNWKAILHRHYGARGRKLSAKIRADGYDGIVTVGHLGGVGAFTKEIVDLRPAVKSNPIPVLVSPALANPSLYSTYPTIRDVRDMIRRNIVSSVRYKVLDAFIVGSEARGTAGPDSDLDIAVIIPKSNRVSSLERSERYHEKFMDERHKPHWNGRVVDIQFFYPDDPELQAYSKIMLLPK